LSSISQQNSLRSFLLKIISNASTDPPEETSLDIFPNWKDALSLAEIEKNRKVVKN